MTPAELEGRVNRLGPWHCLIELEPGVFTIPRKHWIGLWHNIVAQDYMSRTLPPLLSRLNDVSQADTSVLDIGCNEGWLSLLLCRLGYKRILGIDPQPANIKKAMFLKEHFGMTNVDFLCADAETFVPDEHFDFAIMLGVINHMHNPVGILQRIYVYTRKYLLLDFDSLSPDYVDNSPEPQFSVALSSVYGNMRCFFEQTHPVTSAAGKNLVFQYSKRAVLLMMNYAGFSDVVQVMPKVAMPSHYKNEKRVFLIGHRNPVQQFVQDEILLDQDYASDRSLVENANPVLVEEGYRGYNIVSYLDGCYGIPQGVMTQFDILRILRDRSCVCGPDLHSVRRGIDSRVKSKNLPWRHFGQEVSDEEARDVALIREGRDLIWQSRLGEAAKLFEELLGRHRKPETEQVASIYYELGRIAARQGKKEEARKWWQDCLSVDPEFQRASRRLANLEDSGICILSHSVFE